MLKKYLWGAIVPVLAVFVLIGAGARPKPDTLTKQNDACSTKTIIDSVDLVADTMSFGKISGVVIDVKTREAISGALVTLLGLNMCDSTNLGGRYTITNVPEGRYNVQAKITGYEPQVIVAKTKIRQIVPVNFVLKPTIIGTKDSGIVKPSECRTTTETEHRSITTEEIERMEKPNIYLYPTKQETLTVKVHPKGKITSSIPEYGTGWNFVVVPGGRINDTYDFLFYEATVDYNFTLDAGWVLQRSNFDRRMNEILVNIGLNDKERGDFMEYWPKRMDWKKKYCTAYYLKRNEIDQAIPLTISKTPESLMRLFFKFVPTDILVSIPEPKIEKFQRIGFSVVEWGGILD